jgi:hypothetical protein
MGRRPMNEPWEGRTFGFRSVRKLALHHRSHCQRGVTRANAPRPMRHDPRTRRARGGLSR